jgi:hypothetical protein
MPDSSLAQLGIGPGLSISGGNLVAAGGTPGGSNTQIQFNNSGAFGGSSGLTWNGATLTTTAFSASSTVNLTGVTNSAGGPTFKVVSMDTSTGKLWTAPFFQFDTTGYYLGKTTVQFNGTKTILATPTIPTLQQVITAGAALTAGANNITLPNSGILSLGTSTGTGAQVDIVADYISLGAGRYMQSSGARANSGWDRVTNGTSFTIPLYTTNILIDPASVTTSMTITLPTPTGIDGYEVRIHFGGQIASGGVVVTSLTIAGGGTFTLVQSPTPTTALAGQCLVYRAFYDPTDGIYYWLREN